jgi:hypothetical protein
LIKGGFDDAYDLDFGVILPMPLEALVEYVE